MVTTRHIEEEVKDMLKSIFQSELGDITILANDHGVIGVWFEDQAHFGAGFDLDQVEVNDHHTVIKQTKAWLTAYFNGENPQLSTLPLNPQGTAYQQEVWSELQKVPYGQTITYQELADNVAARQSKGRGSARAVGGAVGRNPISIIVPCHRVVGTNGDLTGYAGGIGRKVRLLSLEGVDKTLLGHR